MDELIERLKSQAGLSQEQADKAAGIVADFLANHVSGDQLQSLAGQVPGLSRFSDKIPDNVGEQLGGMVGGLFGKKND